MRRRWLLPIVVLALFAAGCGGGDDDDSAEPDETTTTTTADETTTTTTGVGNEGDNEWDQLMVISAMDQDAFWSELFPELYGDDFEPISGGLWAYAPDTEQPPCGEPAPQYDQIAGNAFYCPSADLIAWDSFDLMPRLLEEFGGFTLGLVMAHEFGHAIQARVGFDGPTILTEQQADCFAGAWTAWVADGGSEFFEVTLSDLDASVAGFLQLADQKGSVSTDPSAHGSAFDRVSAFQDGFANGGETCAAFSLDTLQTFQLPFQDEEEFETGGELAIDILVPGVVDDLELFWSLVLPDVFGVAWDPVDVAFFDPADGVTCGGDAYGEAEVEGQAFYCIPDDYIGVDARDLLPSVYESIGDFAAAVIIANQYSNAAEVRLGDLDNSVESSLRADCFTGSWTASLLPGFRTNIGLPENLNISPGDLDEAVTSFLAFGDSAEAVASGEALSGTAFQKVAAFRSGFLNGITACVDAGAIPSE